LALQFRQVKAIHHSSNRGIAESLRSGFRVACYPFVSHNGMDYPFDFRDLRFMIPLLNEADIVVAVRRRYSGYTAFRRFVSWVNVLLLNFFFDLHLRDYNFAQLYRKSVLDAIRPEAQSAGFFIPEILIRAHAQGFRIKQIDLDYHARLKGKPSCGRPSVIFGSLRDLIRFWFKQRMSFLNRQ